MSPRSLPRRSSGTHARRCALALAVACAVVLVACQRGPDEVEGKDVRRVVATTTMLADLAMQVGGDSVEVHSIMRPGGDPHLYQPTPSDASAVADADVVVTSGLGLEGWIEDLIPDDTDALVASSEIEPIRHPDFPGGVDPHFWFDLERWAQAARTVGAGLEDAVDTDRERRAIATRTEEYVARIDALHAWTVAQLATIPDASRKLVTSHDAFNYLAAAYALEVEGLQGLTTEQQPSQRDVAELVDSIRTQGVPTVFVETSVNPALIERVATEAGVETSGPLHSDSLGPEGSGAATFEEMFVANVRMIVEGLGGSYTAP